MKRNLVGQVFHYLTVISATDRSSWVCRCRCGTEVIVDSHRLLSKHTKSCGCWNKECRQTWGKNRRRDLSGQLFGELIVLAECDARKNGIITWLCLCRCGKQSTVRGTCLTSGHTTSCGHKMPDAFKCEWDGRSSNPKHKNYQTRKYQLNKIHRTPKWADMDAIRAIYRNCPDGFEVDHIYPLQGKLISGLHIETNLTFATPKENRAKWNYFTPHILYPDGTIQLLTN